MKQSELEYVTAEDIQRGEIKIKSAEAMAEATEYNHGCTADAVKYEEFRRQLRGVVRGNILLLGVGMFFILMYGFKSPICKLGGSEGMCACMTLILFALLFYFVFFRKMFNVWFVLAVSAVLVFMNLMFIAVLVIDPIAVSILGRVYGELSEEAGFPRFNLLRTIWRDERYADMDYDDNKTDMKDDEGFLQ